MQSGGQLLHNRIIRMYQSRLYLHLDPNVFPGGEKAAHHVKLLGFQYLRLEVFGSGPDLQRLFIKQCAGPADRIAV